VKNTCWALVITGAVFALAGCGGSRAKHSADSHHGVGSGAKHSADTRHASAPPVCNPRAVTAMARFLKVAPKTIATSKSIGNNDMPQCTFTERTSAHHQVQVVANVDSSPQPYQVLRRTIEEASQVFVPQRLSPAPTDVPGLGIAASWFPDYQWLQATDGLRLITAGVAWTRSTQQQKIALATAAIRPYLTTLSTKQVNAIVNGGSIP
jgi:hypothetical protein